MLIDFYADYFSRNPNVEISKTTDFDEEVAQMMKDAGAWEKVNGND